MMYAVRHQSDNFMNRDDSVSDAERIIGGIVSACVAQA